MAKGQSKINTNKFQNGEVSVVARKRRSRARRKYRSPFDDMMRQTTGLMKFTIGTTAMVGLAGAAIEKIKK